MPVLARTGRVAPQPDRSVPHRRGAVLGTTVTFGQQGANLSTGNAASFSGNGHIDVPYDPALAHAAGFGLVGGLAGPGDDLDLLGLAGFDGFAFGRGVAGRFVTLAEPF